MRDYKEIVTGRVVSSSGAPVASAKVEMYDKDLLSNDYLGADTTDEHGRFRIGFSSSDFRNDFGLPEGRPDIFLKVKTADGATAKSEVYRELKGTLSEDDAEEVMDLGEVKVEL